MSQYKTYSTMAPDNSESKDISELFRITTPEQRRALVQQNKIVVIDNYTDWCGPCKMTAPLFAKIAQKYSQQHLCVFAKENAEDQIPDGPEEVRGVPCFHFYVNGQFQPDLTITGANMSFVEQTLKDLLSN